MIKMLVGAGIGVVLAVALLLGPFRSSASHADEGTTPSSSSTTAQEDISGLDIKLLLNSAADNIKTDGTRRYYENLLKGYGVDSLPDPSLERATADPLSLLPDMNKVNHVAITAPLVQAGAEISDPEIAQYYYKLLKDAGWEIK